MANPNNFDSLFANGSFPNSSIGTFANAAANPFMTKSPLTDYQWRFLKRDSKEIEDLFFPASTVQSFRNLQITQELDCDCDKIPFESFPVYYERNGKEGYQANSADELLFYVKIFVSKDGAKVKQAYNECKPKVNEVIFYLENNTGDWSEPVMYAKFGNEAQKGLYRSLGQNSHSHLYIYQKVPQLDAATLEELIQNGFIKQPYSYSKLFIDSVLCALEINGLLFKGLGWVCQKVGKGVSFLALPETVWNTDDPKYILKKDGMLAAFQIDKAKIEERMSLVKKEKPQIKLPLEFFDKTIDSLKPYILTFVDAYNKFVENAINDIYNELEKLGIGKILTELDKKMWLSERFAFLCGLWNGLVDFVSGVLQFLGGILSVPYEVGKNSTDDLLEFFDTLHDTISEINLTGIYNAAQNTYQKIVTYFKEQNSDDINSDKVAYICGFGLAFAGTFYIPIANFTKIASFSKIGKAFIPARYLEEISATVAKTGNLINEAGVIAKEKYDEALVILQEIVSLLRQGKDALAAFFEKIWKSIAEWFVKVKRTSIAELLSLGLSRETAEILVRFRLRVISDVVLGAIGSYGKNYAIYHNGVAVFKGSASKVKKLAQKLDTLGKEAAEKYLDDLLKAVRATYKLSAKGLGLLSRKADEALHLFPDIANRPGAVAILEGKIGGKLVRVVNYTSKGLSKGQSVGKRHRLVQEWLEDISTKIIGKNGKPISFRPTHGKCAEPISISDFLFQAEKALGIPRNSMTIEQARQLLEGSVSFAKSINNTGEHLIQGLSKKACDSCNPMLQYFNITEIFIH